MIGEDFYDSQWKNRAIATGGAGRIKPPAG